MSKVEHPVTEPPIIGYLQHAYLLSITMNHPELVPWFYSHYIQLYYYEKSINKVNFYENFDIFRRNPSVHHIYENKIDLIREFADIKPFINNYIKQGYYFCTHLNEFYIPGKRAYKIEDFNHEVLIYGFDDINKYYNILGFDNKSRYRSSFLSYDDYDEAFKNAPIDSEMIFVKPNLEEKLRFNVDMAKTFLQDYLYCANTSRLYTKRDDFAWGLDVYKHLKSYVDKTIDEGTPIDFKYFHILWEHKKCMVSRLDFMLKNGHIKSPDYYSAYQDLEKDFLILRNLVFKSYISSYKNNNVCEKKLTARIFPIIDKAVSVESEILKCIISELV